MPITTPFVELLNIPVEWRENVQYSYSPLYAQYKAPEHWDSLRMQDEGTYEPRIGVVIATSPPDHVLVVGEDRVLRLIPVNRVKRVMLEGAPASAAESAELAEITAALASDLPAISRDRTKEEPSMDMQVWFCREAGTERKLSALNIRKYGVAAAWHMAGGGF